MKRLNTLAILLLGLSLSLTGANATNGRTQEPDNKSTVAQRPNVVVIFADDLGYGDLSCYGATKLKTPNIDRLAEEGRRFTDAHSASAVCTPSRYALITGEYPFRKGLSKPVFLKTGLIIEPDRTTTADVLKDAGYTTACIGKWHLGFGETTPDWNGDLKPGPLELGFDYYYGVPVVNSHPPFVYVENYRVVGQVPEDPFVYGKTAKTQTFPEKMAVNQIGGADAAHALYRDEAVGTHLAEKSVDWIKANKDHPFFLYLATTNIHHPFTPAPRFQGTSDCGRYGDFVHELDWIVGEVTDTLKALGLADNTLVIFTSDNGGMFNAGGQDAWKAGHRLNSDLLGFKFGAWEGGHRVPFIARWPGHVPAGTTSDQLISNIDLLATFAALVDRPLTEGEGPDSFNILPALTGSPAEPIRNHLVLGASKGTHLAFREGKWIYIGAQGSGGFGGVKNGVDFPRGGPGAHLLTKQVNSDIKNGKLKSNAPPAQLYDLQSDLSQSQNLILDNSERAESMRARLEEIRSVKTTRPGLNPMAQASGAKRRAPGKAHAFHTLQLADQFHAESAALGDIDKDGHADVVYGPFWFAGPDFKKRHPIYKPNPFQIGTYSNNFFTYIDDINKDGWKDVLVLGFPRREASTYWFKNPGPQGLGKPWEKFEVFEGVGNESPVWADVNGDGEKEVLCSMDGQFGFVAPADRARPESPWSFTPISPPKSTGGKFTHGLGFGDVNSDGRNDLLEKSGWWEQPEGGGFWIKHPFVFSEEKGGSQMFAYDFDGDGDNDIVSAINAHGYGLAWFEQGKREGGDTTFKKHRIMGEQPEESRYGLAFSQLHGLRLDDVDGDGVLDIVTGKRYFAHGGKDPGGQDAPLLYWFRTTRRETGQVDFIPYQIHDNSGVGVDVITGDANDDGLLDVLVGNKKGCFIHLQTKEEAQAPEPLTSVSPPAPTAPLASDDENSEALLFEGESLKVLKHTGSLRPQNVRRHGAGQWSGNTQIWWTDAKPGHAIEFSLPVVEAGTYRLGVGLTKARDYGIIEFALNGKKLSEPIDLFHPTVTHTGTIPLGDEAELTKGNHRLSVTITGANPRAVQKFMFGLDYVLLHQGDEPDWQQLKTVIRAPNGSPTKITSTRPIKEGNDLTAKPQTPARQQAQFVLPEGFVIELVASEETGLPKPTSIAFDDAGRLWATTAVMYPRDNEPEVWKNPGKDRIGIIDQPHLPTPQPVRTFADGLVMPMSVLPMGSGAVVAQGPEIVYLDDEDQDGRADKRTVLVTGFGIQDTHTMPHRLSRSPGGRITFSQGVLNSGVVIDATGRAHSFNKTLVASMTPQGSDFRIMSAGMNNIWAWAPNRVGRVFIHEANDFGFSLAQFEEDSSYPSFRLSKLHPDAPLHPPTATGLNLGGTGFSGIALSDDRSGSFPAPWHETIFVANPILGKINAATGSLGTDDVWNFKKLDDLVTCGDPMFRPVGITFGPDGCLYIVDWYNRIISHNEVARDHPARDKDRGRIWRVRHTSQTAPSITNYTELPTSQLPAALKSDSTWAMRAAWHQIAQRQDQSVIPELIAMLRDAQVPVDARIHSLWCLEELGYFDDDLWKGLLTQPSADLRREAVRALHSLGVPQSEAAPLLQSLAHETAWTVRYEVLRYFRRADGPVAPENLAWLRQWSTSDAPTTTVPGKNGDLLALDGSYQHAFQNFLLMLAETKTQLPVIIESKWNRVIAANPDPADPREMAKRITAVKALLPNADVAEGRVLTESVCLTCHAIGGKGVGFAPPLDGSASRDLDGLLTAIIDPNAAMETVFRSFRIETKDGTILEGFNQNEGRQSITMLSMGGARQAVPIKHIKSAGYIEGKSVMPDLTGGMTPEQVAGIVAYLRSVN